MKLKNLVRKFIVPAAGVSVLVPALLSAAEVTFAQTNGMSAEDAVAWVRSLEGQGIDFDGSYGNQCVDLIKAYYNYLGETAPRGNAYDYAYNALPDGWERIQGADPQPGDILVYTGGSYGHVAICTGENESYHQNWGGSYVQCVNGSCYSTGNEYWGVIRPDFDGNGVSYEEATGEEKDYSYEEYNDSEEMNEEYNYSEDRNEEPGDTLQNENSNSDRPTMPLDGPVKHRFSGFDYGFRPENSPGERPVRNR